MNKYSISASPHRASATRFRAPLSRQREAYIGSVPMTILGRQVPPWAAGAHDPENLLDEPTIVIRHTALIIDLARQEIFNALPLIISTPLSVKPDSVLSRSGAAAIAPEQAQKARRESLDKLFDQQLAVEQAIEISLIAPRMQHRSYFV